jgi:hypothetical protein
MVLDLAAVVLQVLQLELLRPGVDPFLQVVVTVDIQYRHRLLSKFKLVLVMQLIVHNNIMVVDRAVQVWLSGVVPELLKAHRLIHPMF